MIYIGADHRGHALKKYLIRYLEKQLKREVVDLGALEYNENDDFVDFAVPVAKKVAAEPGSLGILLCGNGQGMCIAANKIAGVRAMLGHSIESTEFTRREDDANIICLPARTMSDEHATAIVKTFLETEFSGEEKRVRRIEKIKALEK
jgi:ribose 5-phosphate isomerase B